MLAGTLSAVTGMQPNHLQVGFYAAALGTACAAYKWYTEESVPPQQVATEFRWHPQTSHAGEIVAAVLQQHGVTYVHLPSEVMPQCTLITSFVLTPESHIFTLCGGHISPILVGCNQAKIRVIDVRHEANAAFAADCYSRLTGVPGVCAGKLFLHRLVWHTLLLISLILF